MVQNEKSKKQSQMLFCMLCCMVYFTSYLTRKNYDTIVVEIEALFSRELASLPSTGALITYGVGQLISGVLGDLIPPRKMIAMGLLATSVVNLLMPMAPNIYVMIVLWCFNGFFQAMLWPPLVRIMAETLDDLFYAKAIVYVSAASSIATVFIKGVLGPVTVHFAGWKPVFLIAGSVGLIVVAVWYIGTRNLGANAPAAPAPSSKEDDTPKVSLKILITSGAAIAMIGILLQGFLRDGIETWMPTYIKDTFNIDSSYSILISSISPIFGIFSVSIASMIHRKLKSELKTSALLFAVALGSSVVLLPLQKMTANNPTGEFNLFFVVIMVLSALLMAVITGCMHGINLMLISRLPAAFKKYGKVSTISGILNACTYVGSAVSTYGFALFSARYGWTFIIVTWAVVAALGALVCSLCIRRWERFLKQK